MQQTTPEEGCIDLVGAIIKQALFDYRLVLGKKERGEELKSGDQFYFDSAEHFLFEKNGLEEFLQKTGLDDVLNVDFIRSVAGGKNAMYGDAFLLAPSN